MLAPHIEPFENQYFKLLIVEDYANISSTTFVPDQKAGAKINKGALII